MADADLVAIGGGPSGQRAAALVPGSIAACHAFGPRPTRPFLSLRNPVRPAPAPPEAGRNRHSRGTPGAAPASTTPVTRGSSATSTARRNGTKPLFT